jgi:NADP-dependent 3-hydroxy acid dehydrogenase YdfG
LSTQRNIEAGPGRLAGQVAIVTGAGSGIGRAAAVALAREGATVAVFGRRQRLLEEVAAEIRSLGGKVLSQSVDVGDITSVDAAVKAVLEAYGRIDVLVNNAGTNRPRRLLADATSPAWDQADDWGKVIETNLTGVFLTIRAVLPAMRQQKRGTIINVASAAALLAGKKSGAAYAAAKRGVVAITQIVNAEEWENNIRATTIYPGDVNTPIMELRPSPPTAEIRAQMMLPEDIAEAIAFVACLPQRALVEDLVIKPISRNV